MNKNDRLIVVIGVVILLIASIGIYLWVPEQTGATQANENDFYSLIGTLSEMPDTVTVSDQSPFYPLIVTPLAVNYDAGGSQHIAPLYVKNLSSPSRAVERAMFEQLTMMGSLNLLIGDGQSPKDISLILAEEYWDKSDAALLIEYNQTGYTLGVMATPLASYMSIPVIVTDEVDSQVTEVLSKLGVEYTLVCGDLEGYGNVLHFTSVEDIVNMTIDFLWEKFGDITYLTLTNPLDAWPPQVLESEEFKFGPETLPSTATTRIGQTLTNMGSELLGTFTIPKDYKYALIKFEGINLDADDVDEFGDSVAFQVGPNLPDLPSGLQNFEAFVGSTAAGGVPVRDDNGNIIEDRYYAETVLYDRGGVEYNVKASGTWLMQPEGRVLANVVVEKIDNPYYEPMEALSGLAPYLTAYHKGLIFGKPEFAFAANDDIITDSGENCPGFYLPRRNPRLTPMSNEHIYDTIHEPVNELLAQLADIPLEKDKDLKALRDYYDSNPLYIALVGGATVLPNYIYQNHVEPVDVEETPYYVGGGTPSDVMYGNIDPIRYDWSNLANDIYTTYPYQENIVGRITGWSAQDASALIARSIFYNDIVETLGDWKDTYGLLMGGGQDFQKPLIRYIIFGNILGLVSRGEPMKYWTGYGQIAGQRTVEKVAIPMEFTVDQAWDEAAMRAGFSDEALSQIKSDTNLLNKLFFRTYLVEELVGEGNVKGSDVMESSNFIWANAHGNQHLFGMDSIKLIASGFGGRLTRFLLEQVLPIIGGGFFGPGSSLGDIGTYDTRGVEGMEFGPSFMWLESCICGKIDGVYPEGSVGQALLHAGVTSLVASPTGSNIAGGYLEPKRMMYDIPGMALLRYIKVQRAANKGEFPDPHFGFLIYNDLCEDLRENNVSIGMAFRNAKNRYLPEDAEWELWWAPPLISTGNAAWDYEVNADRMVTTSSGPGPMLEAKYVSFQEYLLFGDPALNLYEPINEGGK
jgi:hypothetical protein